MDDSIAWGRLAAGVFVVLMGAAYLIYANARARRVERDVHLVRGRLTAAVLALAPEAEIQLGHPGYALVVFIRREHAIAVQELLDSRLPRGMKGLVIERPR